MTASSTRVPERLLLTCEHGGRDVPAEWAALFAGRGALLSSHRGWDPGALALARALARSTGAPLLACTVTRLLVDPNRSPGHPRLFSPLSRRLDPAARRRLVERHHRPHRAAAERAVERAAAAGMRTLHISVHSFTPVLGGRRRDADVGLLYDPRRAAERATCRRWAELVRELGPRLRVRRNYPYRGSSDGLTTALRRRFGARLYLGIELEVNQRALRGAGRRSRQLRALLAESLARLLAERAP
jgi:predicted N-formylglutamate amidohydrolase